MLARKYKLRKAPIRPTKDPNAYARWYYHNVTKLKRKRKPKKVGKKRGR